MIIELRKRETEEWARNRADERADRKIIQSVRKTFLEK